MNLTQTQMSSIFVSLCTSACVERLITDTFIAADNNFLNYFLSFLFPPLIHVDFCLILAKLPLSIFSFRVGITEGVGYFTE